MSSARHAPYKITECLAIGPCRGAGGPTLTSIAKAGFKHVIDLNADNSEKSLSKKAGLHYHPVKTIDGYRMDVWMKKVKETVNVIKRAERAKEKVYLHCTYGRGRSATMSMAYLISKNWSVKEATEYVKSKGRLVWCEGNPVSKYERILQSYVGSVSRRGPKLS
jgi:protein-tyrosine phosphatase